MSGTVFLPKDESQERAEQCRQGSCGFPSQRDDPSRTLARAGRAPREWRGIQDSREERVRMNSQRRGQELPTACVPRFCPHPVARRRAEARWRSRTTWPRALRAVLTDFRSGNIAATSGSSTTMIVSFVNRSAYFPRTPREKSYSGNISSEFRLERPFLIVAPFPWCGSSCADDSNLVLNF